MSQGLVDKVYALKHLPDGDKEILGRAAADGYAPAQAALPELSIFRKRDVKKQDHYRYSQSKDTLYYIGERNRTHQCVFFDSELKMEFNSRYYLTHLANFLQLIDQTMENIRKCDLSKAVDIGSNFVAIEKWYISYGHFQDELFSLADFMRRRRLFGRGRALLDYPTDGHLNTASFQFTPNYQALDKLIFGKDSFNAYNLGDGCVKLSGLTLVENGITCDAFHRFPSAISRKVRKAVAVRGGKKGPEKVFITRSESYRDIGNKEAAEQALADAGYFVVNPENVSIVELIQTLRNAKTVAMYFGSAMTNMIYFPQGTNIHILKSKSYAHEDLAIWAKVIKEYDLNLNVIPASEDNIIDLEAVAKVI